jgi:hypothetical protein
MSYNKHQILVNQILCALSKFSHIRVWANNTGSAMSFDSERIIKFGLEGSADILGVKGPTGQLICIEIKTGSARQSEAQKRFEKVITERGGIYVVARSVDDIKFLLKDSNA